MHSRISLHQVAFLDGTTNAQFIDACRRIGVREMTPVTNMLFVEGGLDGWKEAAPEVKVATVNHPFSPGVSLDKAGEQQTAAMLQAIDATAKIGGRAIYTLTGGRGALTWEQAAARFAELLAPCRAAAKAKGITLLVENASPLNTDFHIVHNMRDLIRLAEIAEIGICIDLHGVWTEGGIEESLRAATPNTGLIQISDYILGDRCTPCRAVPGDGVIPLERLMGVCLEAGFKGLFDLELVGPRIQKEGPYEASLRSCQALNGMLERLGA
jgi:sugar phosphate isomerase/epimerase